MKRFSAILLLLSSVGMLVAQETTGTDLLNFLRIETGVRSAGLGSSYVALADDASGLLANPAGLARQISPELDLSYMEYLAGLRYQGISLVVPSPKISWGLAGRYFSSSDNTPKFVNYQPESDNITYYEGAADFSVGFPVGRTFSFGLTGRALASQIDSDSLTGFAGDAGLLYRSLNEVFSIGLSGQNLYSSLSNGEQLSRSGRLGVAWQWDLPAQYSRINLSLEMRQTEREKPIYSVGIEHWGANVLGLRLGYVFGGDEKTTDSLDSLSHLRAGASLRFGIFAINYAYQPFARLGNVHYFSLTSRFYGWQQRQELIPMEVDVEPTIFSPNGDGVKDNIFIIPTLPEKIKNITHWQLLARDSAGNLVSQSEGGDTLPKIISWEGKAATTTYVSEGKYWLTLEVLAEHNRLARSSAREVIADLTPPTVLLDISTPIFSSRWFKESPLSPVTTFYISATDDSGIERWQLTILNSLRRSVKVFNSTTTVASIVWNGTDDVYGQPVPDGEYLVRLSVWDIAGNKKQSELRIQVSNPQPVKEVVREVQVKETAKGLTVNLSNQVLFDTGKWTIKPVAEKSLQEVVQILNSYPENNVLIEGHTDAIGSRAKNIDLSSRRAWAIYSYLVKNGVNASRLSVKGWGPDKPIASNRTAVGRAQNRRVEITILKK